MVPQELKYTKEHEWVRVENGEAVIGITDHAQSELGDITFVELPQKDTEIKKTEALSTIESVKAASEVYAPLSGKITEVNEMLNEKPEIINESPYTKGWICRIHTADISEVNTLLSATDYEIYLKENE